MNKVGADGSSREKTRMTQVNKPRRPSPKRRIVVQLVGGVDRPFLVTVILLLCLGTVMVFSASYPYANANFKGDSYHFAKRQITWFKRERDVRWLELEQFQNDRKKVLEHILDEIEGEGIR